MSLSLYYKIIEKINTTVNRIIKESRLECVLTYTISDNQWGGGSRSAKWRVYIKVHFDPNGNWSSIQLVIQVPFKLWRINELNHFITARITTSTNTETTILRQERSTRKHRGSTWPTIYPSALNHTALNGLLQVLLITGKLFRSCPIDEFHTRLSCMNKSVRRIWTVLIDSPWPSTRT